MGSCWEPVEQKSVGVVRPDSNAKTPHSAFHAWWRGIRCKNICNVIYKVRYWFQKCDMLILCTGSLKVELHFHELTQLSLDRKHQSAATSAKEW